MVRLVQCWHQIDNLAGQGEDAIVTEYFIRLHQTIEAVKITARGHRIEFGTALGDFFGNFFPCWVLIDIPLHMGAQGRQHTFIPAHFGEGGDPLQHPTIAIGAEHGFHTGLDSGIAVVAVGLLECHGFVDQ